MESQGNLSTLRRGMLRRRATVVWLKPSLSLEETNTRLPGFCHSLRDGVQTHCGCHHPSKQEMALGGSTPRNRPSVEHSRVERPIWQRG